MEGYKNMKDEKEIREVIKKAYGVYDNSTNEADRGYADAVLNALEWLFDERDNPMIEY